MSRDIIDIIASPGDSVTLPCFGPMNAPIEAVEWYRSLFYKSYVYSWRGGDRPETENQLPSYEGHVDVENLEEKKKRKDTDVSLMMSNVRSSDSGTYECHIFNGTMDHSNPETSFGTRSMKNVTVVVVDDIISACPGDDVLLTCDVPMNVPFVALQWNKYGHEDPVHTCVKDQQRGPAVQEHEDCQTNNSTVSVTMNNVQPNDSGVYECRFVSFDKHSSSDVKKRVHVIVSAGGEKKSGRKKRCVTGPGDDGDHNNTDPRLWALVALVPVAAALVVLAAVGYRRYKTRQAKRNKAKRCGNKEGKLHCDTDTGTNVCSDTVRYFSK